MIFHEETWSEKTTIMVRIPSKNPFRRNTVKKIEVVKKFHNVLVFPHKDWAFTAVTFEVADKNERYLTPLVSTLKASVLKAGLKGSGVKEAGI